MKLFSSISALLFPPKCVLCRKLLSEGERDLCSQCRRETENCDSANVKLPHLAQWISLWYYEGDVRKSILRFKFYGQRSYAKNYGSLLADKLLSEDIRFDVLTWVPVSRLRKFRRGYDQVQLIAQALGAEMEVVPVDTLKKLRNNRPQSGLGNASRRRANVLGIYRCIDPEVVMGRRVLLLDDVLTTGATAGECARVLLTAGAKAVICATIAAASHK